MLTTLLQPGVHFAPRLRRHAPAMNLDAFSPNQIAELGSNLIDPAELARFAQSNGVLAFGAVHAAAIILCFPATILFELAAGFVYGVQDGIILVWAVKVAAAAITFAASSMSSSALSRLGLPKAAAEAFESQPALARLAESIEAEGARYTLLARLSPIPSYLNNYGLALAGVKFRDYLPATALATLPPVLSHVYTGSLLSSLLALSDGPQQPDASLTSSALGGLSLICGGLLLRQGLSAFSMTETDETFGE